MRVIFIRIFIDNHNVIAIIEYYHALTRICKERESKSSSTCSTTYMGLSCRVDAGVHSRQDGDGRRGMESQRDLDIPLEREEVTKQHSLDSMCNNMRRGVQRVVRM